MADYFTHFSCLIDVGSPDKCAHRGDPVTDSDNIRSLVPI
jgi:hypothetical protein